MKTILKIFKLAKEKGLKNVSIKIDENLRCVLYVEERDRWGCESLDELLQAMSEHEENLAWMNN